MESSKQDLSHKNEEKEDLTEKGEEEKQPLEKELNDLEKTDTESEVDTENEGKNKVEQEKEDKENKKRNTKAYRESVHWRINFRTRNYISSDLIIVDATSPVEESSSDPMSQFGRGPNGEILAVNFQFRHELKNSTYKNKYIIRLDSYKMTFSERDDSILIRSGPDATVHMGIANNTLLRGGNMAMEELRKLVGMKLRVWRSLFVSNRSQQMGVMDLSKCVNTITAVNLTVVMDSYQNVVEIIKLHRPELNKFTLICTEEFAGILELEQIRNVPNLKLDGPSGITNEQLLALKANNFEITSEKITSSGLTEFIKDRLAKDIADDYYASVSCNRERWSADEILRGLDYTEYENEAAYVRINGSLPINVFEATLVSMATNKPDERLVLIINKYYFECFKESKKPYLLCHDTADLD